MHIANNCNYDGSTTDYDLLANFTVLVRGEVQIQDQVQGVAPGGPGEFREIREVTFVKDQGQCARRAAGASRQSRAYS